MAKSLLEQRIEQYKRWQAAIKRELQDMQPGTVRLLYRCLVYRTREIVKHFTYSRACDVLPTGDSTSHSIGRVAELIANQYVRTLWRESFCNELFNALQNPAAPDDWEWDVEVIESDVDEDGSECGDIVDHLFQDTYADCWRSVNGYDCENGKYRLEIVLTHVDGYGKSYAYLQLNGKLPRTTDNGTRVPKFFHDEVKAFDKSQKSAAQDVKSTIIDKMIVS